MLDRCLSAVLSEIYGKSIPKTPSGMSKGCRATTNHRRTWRATFRSELPVRWRIAAAVLPVTPLVALHAACQYPIRLADFPRLIRRCLAEVVSF